MKRLYFLAPDAALAHAIVDELRKEVDERHLYVLADADTPLHESPAPPPQEDEFAAALQTGVAVGGGAGLFIGLTALAFPPAGLVVGGGALLLSTALGAGIGAWLSGLMGAQAGKAQAEAVQQALARGEVLILVDVAAERVAAIRAQIAEHHPQADIGVLDHHVLSSGD